MLLGTDNTLTITLTDSAGAAINLTTYDNIIVLLKTKRGVLQKYSREVLTDYDSDNINQLDQVTNTGEFTLTITDDLTKERQSDSGEFTLSIKAVDSAGTHYGWIVTEHLVTTYDVKKDKQVRNWKPLEFKDFAARYESL